ncbi:hypothetical protein BE08_38255 [Sorangium cellulosum]|uniref:Uncharacterized protein n=1 Tax=Sorangium cellulosum TaxID=56 RepID=A0A150PEJ2_SORCE|nr:hypothetical protein BE08_38255 [Sorangium cellulosum]
MNADVGGGVESLSRAVCLGREAHVQRLGLGDGLTHSGLEDLEIDGPRDLDALAGVVDRARRRELLAQPDSVLRGRQGPASILRSNHWRQPSW